jgi:hypothetical protein
MQHHMMILKTKLENLVRFEVPTTGDKGSVAWFGFMESETRDNNATSNRKQELKKSQ